MSRRPHVDPWRHCNVKWRHQPHIISMSRLSVFRIFWKPFSRFSPIKVRCLVVSKKKNPFVSLLNWAATWDFQQCGNHRPICDQQMLRPACAYAQSDQSFCLLLEYPMTLRLLIEYYLEFLSWKGGYTCSSEPTLVKMPHCCDSFVIARQDLGTTDRYIIDFL